MSREGAGDHYVPNESGGARGSLPFDAQEDTIRSAWVSANLDHFAYEPDCYSNRLPISLASRTVHQRQYGELPCLMFVDRPQELVPGIRDYVAETSPVERLEHARQAWAYAEVNHRLNEKIAVMLNAGGAAIDLVEARAVFRPGNRTLTAE